MSSMTSDETAEGLQLLREILHDLQFGNLTPEERAKLELIASELAGAIRAKQPRQPWEIAVMLIAFGIGLIAYAIFFR